MNSRSIKTLAFIEGACVMLLELSIPHVIAPVLGNSIAIWSAMILMSVGGLSIGYFIGGYLASTKKLTHPIHVVFTSGIILLAICLILISIQNWIGFGIDEQFSAYLIVALSLFFPSVIFGTLPPLLISEGKNTNKNIVGDVFFYSTIGGVLFTLMTGYFFIPRFGLMLTLSFGLIILLFGLFYIENKHQVLSKKKWIIGLFVLFSIGFGNLYKYETSPEIEILYFSEGLNGQLLVAQTPTEKILFINRMGQTRVYRENGASVWTYPYFIKSLASIQPPQSKSLVLGLGGGIVPMDLQGPDINHIVTAVEIDSKIIHVAHEFFGLNKSTVEVIEEDGRRFINKTIETYDLIVVDVFNGEIAPSHVLSKEAFQRLKKILSSNGFVVVNFNGFLNHIEGISTRSLIKTIRSAGFNLKICPTLEEGESHRNNILIAYLKEPDWSSAQVPIMYNERACRVGIEFPFYNEKKIQGLEAHLITDDKPLMEDLNKHAAKKWRAEYLKDYTLKYRDEWSVPLIK